MDRPDSNYIDWTPVDRYPEMIAARSKLRGWDLTKLQIDEFAASLPNHAGPLLPTGISLWLGRDLKDSWHEALAWVHDQMSALDNKVWCRFDDEAVSFYPGSEQAGSSKLDVVGLDISTFWDRKGTSPKITRPQRARWPGLEVAWLLALSPQVYSAMDTVKIPGLWAPGLTAGSRHALCFDHDEDNVFINNAWDEISWSGYAPVCFRRF